MAQRYPGLELDVRLHDTFADLVEEGIDVAVRIGHLKDSTLVAQRIMFRNPSTGRDRPWQFRQGAEHVDLHPPTRIRMSAGKGASLLQELKSIAAAGPMAG